MKSYKILIEIPEQYIVDEEFVQDVFDDAFIDGVYVAEVQEIDG